MCQIYNYTVCVFVEEEECLRSEDEIIKISSTKTLDSILYYKSDITKIAMSYLHSVLKFYL